jgi:hypothetical protein
MTGSNRLAIALAAAAASVTLASGCTAAGGAHPVSSPSGPGTATASFSAMGLAFRYPAAWRLGRWSTGVSSFTALIVDLSTSRLKDPCSVTSRLGRTSVFCGYPVKALPPGGVLVSWNADGFPFSHPSEPNATIAGRKAIETRTTGGWCATLRGTETITVKIFRSVPDNWYEMDACLRAPGLARPEAEIASMLSSVRIAKGY